MRRMLNTLYVLTTGTRISREGLCLLLEPPEREPVKVPVGTLEGLICQAGVTCTPPLLELCADHGVTVTFLSEYNRFLARVEGPVSGNVLLRREQYRREGEAAASLILARAVVAAKVANSRRVLLRAAREGSPEEPLQPVIARMEGIVHQLERVDDLERVRGLEGEAAALYWQVFGHLLRESGKEFVFSGRNRRPPLDAVNALLSFLYILLVHDVRSALETVGLDPQVGYLHRLRPGRPSLALDVMEEFRAPVADRLALTLINRGQVQPKGFKTEPNGAVAMTDATRREVLVAWQERKREEVTHSFLGEKMPVGLLWYGQALLLARHLRGDLEGYPAYVWR